MEPDTRSPHVTPRKGGEHAIDPPDDHKTIDTNGEQKFGSDERARLTK